MEISRLSCAASANTMTNYSPRTYQIVIILERTWCALDPFSYKINGNSLPVINLLLFHFPYKSFTACRSGCLANNCIGIDCTGMKKSVVIPSLFMPGLYKWWQYFLQCLQSPESRERKWNNRRRVRVWMFNILTIRVFGCVAWCHAKNSIIFQISIIFMFVEVKVRDVICCGSSWRSDGVTEWLKSSFPGTKKTFFTQQLIVWLMIITALSISILICLRILNGTRKNEKAMLVIYT